MCASSRPACFSCWLVITMAKLLAGGGSTVHYRTRSRNESAFAAARDPEIRISRERRIYEYGVRNVDRIVVQTRRGRAPLATRTAGSARSSRTAPPPAPAGGQTDQPLILGSRRSGTSSGPSYSSFWRAAGAPIRDDRGSRRCRTATVRSTQSPTHRSARMSSSSDSCRTRRSNGTSTPTRYSSILPNGKFPGHLSPILAARNFDGFVHRLRGARDGFDVDRVVHSAAELTATLARVVNDDAFRLRQGHSCGDYTEPVHSPDRVLDLDERIVETLLDSGCRRDGR